RLAQGVDTLPGGQAASTHGLDRIPECAGPNAQLEAAAAEDVERGGGTCEDGGWAQRQAGDVRGQVHVLRARGREGEQCRGVEERRLVRMVLERDEVQPAAVGRLDELEHTRGVLRGRRDEGSEE